MCAHFFGMGAPVKNQVENGLDEFFSFWGHNISAYDQEARL